DWVSDFDEDETVVSESLNVQKPKQADQHRKVSQNPRNNSTSWMFWTRFRRPCLISKLFAVISGITIASSRNPRWVLRAVAP
ncbi:hypothetical protein Tco_0326059, partial [Tanacetum coccineum]